MAWSRTSSPACRASSRCSSSPAIRASPTRASAVDIRQVGRELGVRYVLEGSVRKAGNRVRITGQLIDAATGAHLWADRFDGALEDVFELQDRVTTSVVGAHCAERRAGRDRARHAQADRKSARPTTAILRGAGGILSSRHEGQSTKRCSLLQTSDRARSRLCSRAMRMLAAVLSVSQVAGLGSTDPDAERREAEAGSRRALALDRDDARSCWRSAGKRSLVCSATLRSGIALLDQAIALNPNLALALDLSAAGLHGIWANTTDAIEHLERALRLSPLDPRTRWSGARSWRARTSLPVATTRRCIGPRALRCDPNFAGRASHAAASATP